MSKAKIVTILGTRPEVIKLAPVVAEIERRGVFEHQLVATAQHREMLDQALGAFELRPDSDLALMQANQALGDFAARALEKLTRLLGELRPDAVLIQGDTTTVMVAALAAFYQGARVGHVEAGLRSFDRRNPFPEEINRRLAGCLADWHFAPTEGARRNLLAEGVAESSIFVTGNTVVDALQSIRISDRFDDPALWGVAFGRRRVLLVTAHRRENFGEPLHAICRALARLAREFPEIEIVYPVHLNPNVQSVARQELGGVERVHLIAPVSYGDLLRLMRRCELILTDSGGIQEEAPSFHRPVLVLRDVTERPEVIEAGAGLLVGTDEARIFEEAARLLTDGDAYRAMCAAENPFGDGRAASRIVDILVDRL